MNKLMLATFNKSNIVVIILNLSSIINNNEWNIKVTSYKAIKVSGLNSYGLCVFLIDSSTDLLLILYFILLSTEAVKGRELILYFLIQLYRGRW